MQYDIQNRFTGAVIFTCELSKEIESASDGIKIGFAVKAALEVSADLRSANLSYADLSYADLSYANLRSANLSYADLSYAKNIPQEYFNLCRDDLFSLLSSAPQEARGVLAALEGGKVDGSTYEGACACLVGTIANIRGCDYRDLGIKPDGNRPAEQFFMQIKAGDTPETNPAAKMAFDWIAGWIASMESAFGASK